VLIIKNLFNFYVEFRDTAIFYVFYDYGAKDHDSEELECKRDQNCTLIANHIK
jgi:hypothetical protein